MMSVAPSFFWPPLSAVGTGARSATWADLEDLRVNPEGATAGRPEVVPSLPGLAETLGEFARRCFVSMEPSWPMRSAHLYELALEFKPGTGAATAVLTRITSQSREQGLSSPAVMLAEIRAIMGLNIAETARVIGVERPTIYAWLAGRSTPQKANVLRLIRTADVAARWRRHSGMPLGERARVPGPDGRSIVDLMSLDPVPDALVEERLDAARHDLGSAPGAGRGALGVREVARQHGIDARVRPGSQTEIDWLTRRPLGAEDV